MYTVDIIHRFYSYNWFYTVSPTGHEVRVIPVQLRPLVFSGRNTGKI